jgi:microcompartment protein CcmK/EutM
MVAQGPSARNTELTERRSVDAVICGIVDLVDQDGEVVFRK